MGGGFKILTKLGLPNDLVEIMQAIYKKAKKINPNLTESAFIQSIFEEWLEPYSREKNIISKKDVILRNSLGDAIKFAGKSQTKIAEEIGVNRPHLNSIINGKAEPSITLVLLLLNTLNYPIEKIKDLFYLEPVTKE